MTSRRETIFILPVINEIIEWYQLLGIEDDGDMSLWTNPRRMAPWATQFFTNRLCLTLNEMKSGLEHLLHSCRGCYITDALREE